MSSKFFRLVALLLFSLLSACEKPARVAESESMDLLAARPNNRTGVYLNEPLVFDFSHELDRVSVTSRSLRIELSDGTPARGSLRVHGRRVTFEPAPVLSPALNDGGYLPRQRYWVTLVGFPAPEALRGVGGEPLSFTRRFRFTTVENVTWPREGFVFVDDTPERCAPLRVLRDRIAPNETILLGCEEPLDPSTLFADDFILTGPPDTEPIKVQARVIQNGKQATLVEDPEIREWAAVIELIPLGPLEEARRRTVDAGGMRTQRDRRGRPNLMLQVSRNLRLADFSGNPAWLPAKRDFGIYIENETPSSDLFRESFVDKQRWLPIRIEGVDGTALWSDSGRLEIRYPRSAGSGADGDLLCGEEGEPQSESRRDLNASRVRVGAQGLKLSSEPGLCVIRSQGLMRIEGELTRKTGAMIEPMRWPRDVEPAALSDWLATAKRRDTNWTVLIAGGDLVIEGSIVTDTPILLVAGGMIRIGASADVRCGRVSGEARQELYSLGEGGGRRIKLQTAWLTIDPPQFNRLVRPMSFGVLSKQIPQDDGPIAWDSAVEVIGAPGGRSGGKLTVSYVRSVPPSSFDPSAATLFFDPSQMDSAGPVHFYVRIDLPKAPDSEARGLTPWSPPFLDEIILTAK